MIAGSVWQPVRYLVAGRLGPRRIVAEPRWSDRRIRPGPRRVAARSAGASTGPVRAAVPPPGCRSPDGTRSGRWASPRPAARQGVRARADPGRAPGAPRAADSGRPGVVGEWTAAGRAAGPRATSRWVGGPAQRRHPGRGVWAGGSVVRRVDRRGRDSQGGAVVRHSAAVPGLPDARGAPGAAPRAHRGVAPRPRDAGPTAHCPPGRPDPGPSAAPGWRAAPAAGAGATLARHPFRGTLPRDTVPTVRDLRALMIARADRHPPMNLAFPQLAADATVFQRLRGIQQ